MLGRFQDKKTAFYGGIEAMRAIFGGAASTGTILVAVFIIASIGWFGDALMAFISPEKPPLWGLLPVFVIALIVGRFLSKAPSIAPSIKQRAASGAKILIWFLSPPTPGLERETNPEKMRAWRMAFEAIKALGADKLDKVVVIPSKDSSGTAQDGTWRQVDNFRIVMAASSGIAPDKIVLPISNDPTYRGVDFEDAVDLFDALDNLYDALNNEGYSYKDIILDVTGGQKIPGVMGGIIGLGEGRRIQYVSTRDYKVHEYDITWGIKH